MDGFSFYCGISCILAGVGNTWLSDWQLEGRMQHRLCISLKRWQLAENLECNVGEVGSI